MTKTLGQIAHEAGEKVGNWLRTWDNMSNGQKYEWEAIAAAVAAAVKEEDAKIVENYFHLGYQSTVYETADELAEAIRASIKP